MDRRNEILKAIVKHFIDTAEPVGSQTLVVSYDFRVSPATIRNDMATLERDGFIEQPHISAGRIPTDLGYRLYVDELSDVAAAEKEAEKVFIKTLERFNVEKVRNKLYDAVSLIADATNNVSFATVPDNPRTFYLGISNVMRQPEFMNDPIQARQVIEILEKGDNFMNTLRGLPVDDDVKIFIGKENLLRQIESCSLMVTTYEAQGYDGYIGVLGPKRMRYPFNRAIVEKVKELLV